MHLLHSFPRPRFFFSKGFFLTRYYTRQQGVEYLVKEYSINARRGNVGITTLSYYHSFTKRQNTKPPTVLESELRIFYFPDTYWIRYLKGGGLSVWDKIGNEQTHHDMWYNQIWRNTCGDPRIMKETILGKLQKVSNACPCRTSTWLGIQNRLHPERPLTARGDHIDP